MSNDNTLNGHMNRNIRTQLQLIDMAKPYISVVSSKVVSDDNLELEF